ncbi:MAG: hypothetical protein COA58_13380 [Bacteroidetes bacterium]|nr:MAG: hypothetical protein COA58_13380 [Bacteroidota bacterium]
MRLLTLILLCSLLFSCSKLTVSEPLPDIEGITPSSISSDLTRINIVADADLFENMYLNFAQNIEISAQIEYFDEKGILLLDESAKIRIRGSGSALNDMKSIGIIFTKKIDNLALQIINTEQVLPGDDLCTLQSIRLRNSGNDDGVTHIKDLALTEFAIANSIDLELKYGTATQVFINGKYYGLLNIRTENDRIALSDLLQVDSSSITMLKSDFKNGNMEYKEGNFQLAQRLNQAIDDEDVFELKRLIDITNFIDYILFEDYLQNTDWPHNNARMYSVNGSKFRFLLFDLDRAFIRPKMNRLPLMEYLDDDISKMYQILRANDENFIPTLEKRQKELYTLFSPTRFNEIVDQLAHNIDGEIKYLIKKYGAPHSTLQWKMNVDKMKRDFDRNDHYNRNKYDLN